MHWKLEQAGTTAAYWLDGETAALHSCQLVTGSIPTGIMASAIAFLLSRSANLQQL